MFVDDIEIKRLKKSRTIKKIKKKLITRFEMIGIGLINFHLGPKV